MKTWLPIFQTSGAKIYGLVIGILVTSLTARYLGPDGRGVLAAAVSWATLIATLGSLSLSQVVLHMAAGKERAQWLPATTGTTLLLVALLSVVSWSAATVAYAVTNGAVFNNLSVGMLLLAFAAVPFLMWVENGNAILMSLDSLKLLNLAQIIGATLNIVLIWVIVGLLKHGVAGALLVVLVYQALIGGICLIAILRQAGRVRVEREVGRQLLSGGARLHLNAIGALLFTQVTIVILNHFRSTEETGYYQLSIQLLGAIQIVPQAVNMVMYTVIAKDGPDKAWLRQRRLLWQALSGVVAIVILLYFLAPYVIALIAGPKFAPALPVFRILLLSVIGMSFSTMMASQWIGRGLFWQVSAITLSVGMVNASLTYLVVPRYGMAGAAWATVATFALASGINALMALWVERNTRLKGETSDA